MPEHGPDDRQVKDIAVHGKKPQGAHQPASFPVVEQLPFARDAEAADKLGARAGTDHSRVETAGMIQDQDHGPVHLQDLAYPLTAHTLEPEE